ncbi:MAG: DEAD/DEAH box helicase [Dehalococcoidia bacterium]|nr:DEAD/DEAH box helicase [Dehalococcoidia bacterium]
MSVTLYPWQEAAVYSVIAHLHENPVLVAPTGGGKTSCAVGLIDILGKRTIFLAHRQELIDQAHRRLGQAGIEAGKILPGEPFYPSLSVQVASKDTVRRRGFPWVPELIIIDEAHHAVAKTYRAITDLYPDVPLVGLTATPFRKDGKPLRDVFGRLVIAANFDDLVAEGLLVEPSIKCPNIPDLSGVSTRGGDFDAAGAEDVMKSSVITGNIVDHWMRLAKGRRTLMYASGVEHSLLLVEAFKKAGVKAEHVDGDTPKGTRKALVQALEKGEIEILSNVDLFTEGTDIPSLEVAIVARCTASLMIHIQICGRVVRACEGKEGALILDHAGNALRHGPLNQPINYSLDGKLKKPRGPQGIVCKSCGAFFVEVPGEYDCLMCGSRYRDPPPEGRKGKRGDPEHVDGELVDYYALASSVPFPIRKAFWDSVESARVARGYSEGWSWHRYTKRFMSAPVLVGRALVDPKDASPETTFRVWQTLDLHRKEKGWKPGWAAYRYKDIFGQWPKWKSEEVS